jgi:hypothetical protein
VILCEKFDSHERLETNKARRQRRALLLDTLGFRNVVANRYVIEHLAETDRIDRGPRGSKSLSDGGFENSCRRIGEKSAYFLSRSCTLPAAIFAAKLSEWWRLAK